MKINRLIRAFTGFVILMLTGILQLSATEDVPKHKDKSACRSVSEVEGEYRCSGECVVRSSDDNDSLVEVTGEVDVIRKIEGAKTDLYRSEISGSHDFHEVEIGALTGMVMRTATAKVSDGKFPVLEEYVFEHDASCVATAYTKIVRNPEQKNFKACHIHCVKQY